MRCPHIHKNTAGESTIGEADVPIAMAFADKPLTASRMYTATGVQFVQAEPCIQDWHAAPRRQLFVLLYGDAEFETSDGSKLQLKPGSVVLVDDMSSKGHITRVRQKSLALYVPVPDGLAAMG